MTDIIDILSFPSFLYEANASAEILVGVRNADGPYNRGTNIILNMTDFSEGMKQA